MAKREEDEKDEKDDERDDDESEASDSDPSEERDEAEDESEEDESDDGESEEDEKVAAKSKEPVDAEYEDEDEDEKSEDASEDDSSVDKAARSDLAKAEDEGEDDVLPTHLGAQKYVYSSFIGMGVIFAYIVGRALHGIWAMLSNRDFFALRFPWATSIHDDTKGTYSMVAGGLIAIVVSLRTIRRPSVRQWAEDVAGELVKVKWPNRKEVQNSTVVVIATSLIAVTYLFLLDRFWGFLTDRIYSLGG